MTPDRASQTRATNPDVYKIGPQTMVEDLVRRTFHVREGMWVNVGCWQDFTF